MALLAVLVAAATAVPALDGLHAYTFEDFSREFRRTYATAEVAARRAQFNQNRGMILAHNARNDSWTMTINQLADLSPAEIKARRGVSKSARLGDLPAESDWRDKGIIAPIKDQGQCGSSDDPWPCASGDTKEDGQCVDNFTAVAKFTGFVKLPENNLTAVMGALATLLGPLAVVVDASSWSFYAAGIARPNSWATVDLDHGVQLVGYGTQDGTVSPARCEPILPDSAAPPAFPWLYA